MMKKIKLLTHVAAYRVARIMLERISKLSFGLQMALLEHDFVEKMSGSYG